jgi:two-component system sensor histidine kinase/response regulator
MKFLSIKKRLIMVLMIASLTSLVIATLAFAFYELQRYKKAKQAELVQISDLLAPQSRRHLMTGDVQQAEGWLAILAELRNVREAALYDEQGNFFAGYQRTALTLPALPRSIQDIPEISFTDATGTSLQRLYHQDRPQGFFLVAVDLDDARSGLLSIIVIFILVALVTLAVAYAGAFHLYGQFKKPIVSLVDTARFICEKKDFKARAKKYSSDEMGLLTDTINSMLDEIAKREEGMHLLTEELESRVQTRTAALQEINARLSSEKTRADQAATVKSDFLANMSHEIRTPMNGIVAACDLAME